MMVLYSDVDRITKSMENLTKEKCLSKLFEECGELAQSVNKTIGLKGSLKNDNDVRDEIIEEMVDAIQNIFCIGSKFGIRYEEITEMFPLKNNKWEASLSERDRK